MPSILLVTAGACIMLYSIIPYYKFLFELKTQAGPKKSFSNFIYLACLIMMSFFLIGYIVIVAVFAIKKTISSQESLFTILFYFGAIFVFLMTVMVRRLYTAFSEKSRVLTLQKEAAIAASEAKSQFLANISHEIRTPMNAILGMSELLFSENISNRQKQYVDDIKTAAMVLLDIINDILDISKIQTGKMNLVPVNYNFKELIDNICSMTQFLIKDKNVAFKVDTQGKYPKCLFGDDVRLRQILLNLLSNAAKFTKAGHIHLSITITETNLYFTIRDTGRGIHKKDIPDLFGAFKQFDSVKNRNIEGTGLGLTITSALVEMMGGKIDVESEYGKGTTFYIVIPNVPGDETQLYSSDLDEKIVFSSDTKILAVDDNIINLNVICGLLSLFNITPSTAESGQQAIEMLGRNKYDIIFMDHMMPEMDGVETVKIIREMGITTPVVALTANAVKSAKEMLLSSGMDDFLSKPIVKEELNRILVKWIPSSNVVGQQKIKSAAGNKDPDKNREFWEKIGKVEELSVQTGLKRVSGQADVYESTLNLLCKGIDSCLGNLEGFLAAGDMQNFTIEIHSMKTSLANVGAMELSSMACELETASGSMDCAYCSSAMPPFSAALLILRDKLKDAFSLNRRNKTQVITSELAFILTTMKEAFKNTDFTEINNGLKNLDALNLENRLKYEIEEINNAVMVMDYDAAAEMIDMLLDNAKPAPARI